MAFQIPAEEHLGLFLRQWTNRNVKLKARMHPKPNANFSVIYELIMLTACQVDYTAHKQTWAWLLFGRMAAWEQHLLLAYKARGCTKIGNRRGARVIAVSTLMHIIIIIIIVIIVAILCY
jgi:hypothetical protein